MTDPPPVVGCPTCGSPLTVVDDYCGICGSTFVGRELWERYEAQPGKGARSAEGRGNDRST